MKSNRWWQAATFIVPILMIALSIRGDAIVTGWDMDLSGLQPGLAIHRAFHVWAGYANLGYDGGLGVSNIAPVYAIMWALHAVRIPYVAVQWILYFAILVCTCRGMYALARRLLPTGSDRLWTIIALVYILNFYTLITWFTPLLYVILAYMFAPIIGVVAYDLIGTFTARAIIIATVIFALSSGAGANLAYWLMMVCVFAGCCGIAILRSESDRGKAFLRTAFAAAVFIGVNVWWLAPAAHSSFAHLHELTSTTYSLQHNDGALVATSDASTLSRSVRLIGTWDFFNSDRLGSYYLTFAKFFQPGTIGGVLTFILPWLLLRSLRIPHPRILAYVAIWFVVAVFLMKGVTAPFNDLFWNFYRHVPGAPMFRTPFTKFGMIAAPAFAVLIGFALDHAIDKSKREAFLALLLGAIFIASIGVNTMFRLNNHQPSYFVHIPPAYENAARFASSVGTERILSLPLGRELSFTAFAWGYNGTDPYYRLLRRDAILERNNWANVYADQSLKILDHLALASPSEARRILDFLDVDTIIVHHDILWNFYHTEPADNIEKVLRSFCDVTSFRDVRSGLAIDVLHRRDSAPGRILVTKRLLRRTPDNIALLLSLRHPTTPEISRDAIMTAFIKNQDVVSPGPVPTYTMQRLDPGHYILNVTPNHFQFYVSLRESYDAGWTARYLSHGIWHSAEDHFQANGYQNGWYIGGTDVSKVDIYYAPQRYAIFGLVFSILFFILALVVAVLVRRRSATNILSPGVGADVIDMRPEEALVGDVGFVAVIVAALLDFMQRQGDADIAIAVMLTCFAVLSVRHVRRLPRREAASDVS